ncbi:MAG: phosphoenolpyruvate--protein phosphotransferase [Pseudoflavonifractor sp.]
MKLTGKAVSKGVVIGTVLRYEPFRAVVTTDSIPEWDVPAALARYEATLAKARAELDGLEARVMIRDPDKAKIVYAHREILLDPAMDEEIRGIVTGELVGPDAAIEQVYNTYIKVLGRSKNEMMRERVSDLRDVKNRLLRCWAGAPERDLSSLPSPVVLVADDLFPSDTVSMDRENVLGIITQVGGATCHTAIIARSYEIPAVLGVADAMALLSDGEEVILDAAAGEVITQPEAEDLRAYRAKAERVRAELAETRTYLATEPVMTDGTRVEIRLNVAAANEHELSGAEFSDGCGLFRTEFLYLNGEQLPGEDQQYEIYKKVLLAFGEKPVILRTMDIGGDKQLPLLNLPKEDNPFLGIRGLRLSLERPELFAVQIRAALRASAYGNLSIMMPMVGALDETRRAKQIIAEQGAALDAAGIPWNHKTPIGIMIEIPSVALIADLIVDEVDFASVGTNDLCQYLCAADRMNPAMKPYYQDYHPAMFRVLGYLAKTFHGAGKSVSICGELGGDALALPALIGMGITKQSMGLASMAGAKRVVRGLDMASAQALAEEIQHLKTEGEIRTRLQAFADR